MISETYREIQIVLLEEENKWRFSVNGRERTTLTITNARESIDKALDSQPKKKWEPIKAYWSMWKGREIVTITSVAERQHCGGLEVWISTSEGRKKESLKNLFSVTPDNDLTFKMIDEARKSIEGIETEIKKLKSKLIIPEIAE